MAGLRLGSTRDGSSASDKSAAAPTACSPSFRCRIREWGPTTMMRWLRTDASGSPESAGNRHRAGMESPTAAGLQEFSRAQPGTARPRIIRRSVRTAKCGSAEHTAMRMGASLPDGTSHGVVRSPTNRTACRAQSGAAALTATSGSVNSAAGKIGRISAARASITEFPIPTALRATAGGARGRPRRQHLVPPNSTPARSAHQRPRGEITELHVANGPR
jgi:hypothetical protein